MYIVAKRAYLVCTERYMQSDHLGKLDIYNTVQDLVRLVFTLIVENLMLFLLLNKHIDQIYY